jgi:GWxTD domain-containing protein
MNQALGWTLLHFVWEGAAVALLLAAVLPAVRTARVRYGAACLAMLAMAAAFAVTLWVEWPARAVGAPDQKFEVTQPVLRVVPQGDGPVRPGGPPAWVAEIWIAGVLLLAIRRIAGWHATRRLRTVGTCVAAAPWPERLAQLSARLRIGRPVVLLESCMTDVPLLVGYLRPVILVPAGLLAGLPAEQLEYILVHELAHIARHDYLVNLLQSAVEALLFYHPAVWWVSSVMRAERENCCDDAVVAVNGDARGYAAALVRIEESRAPEPALAANGGSLSRRVRRLLGREQSYGPAGPVLAVVAVLLIAGISLRGRPQQKPVQRPETEVGSHFAPVAAEPAPQDPQERRRAEILARGEPTPYKKWVKEDVAYIITDQERTAFKQLGTDEEREHFIEQFWLRRDPTPGTPENEMKEEHYRRIAYSNEHFATGIPGWKTDRGRVYITYGPPDEIEDHSNNNPPVQQWRYRFIDGVGENVIVEFAGPKYRMTMDPNGFASLTAPAATIFPSSNIRPAVTVNVSEDRSTTIDIALDPAFSPITIYGQIDGPTTPQGPIRDIFQSSALEGKSYRHAVTLPPGNYVLHVRMRNLNGENAVGLFSFTVK